VFFSGPWKSSRETVAGVLLGSFPMMGSRIREGKWTSNHVDAAIALDVGVNLVALSWVPSCPDLNKWHESCFVPWQSWDDIRSLESRSMQYADAEVCAAFSLLMVPFNPGMCKIPD
jgi:hypothetical protein